MSIGQIIYKKIKDDEFENLRNLFDGNDSEWNEYKENQISKLNDGEIDICVVQDGEEFIGELNVHYTNNYIEKQTLPHQRVYFDELKILESYNGMGLRQRLLKHAINYLHTKGYTEFTVLIDENNDIEKDIYSKLGFNVSDTKFENNILYLKVINNQVTVRRYIHEKDEEVLNELLEELNIPLDIMIRDFVYIWYDSGDYVGALLPTKSGTTIYMKDGYEDILAKMLLIFEEQLKNMYDDPNINITNAIIFSNEKLDLKAQEFEKRGYTKNEFGAWHKDLNFTH